MSFQATEPLTHDNAHSRPENLDPRVNGPFLDDIRREQEEAYRKSRMAAEQNKEEKPKPAKKAAAKKTAKKTAKKK